MHDTVVEESVVENEKTKEDIQPITILCVDDEKNILSSLRRLLRSGGYNILLAESAAKGLEILEENSVDFIISDMRMPEMDGAEFLTQVAKKWPDTVRVLLTGYADISSTISAVNDGGIYRYVSKPWDDSEIKQVVKQGLEQQFLKREKERLQTLTENQNETLADLNKSLEIKVQQRTEEIKQTHQFLEVAHEQLKHSHQETIPIFAKLIELREGLAAGSSLRIAELAKSMAAAVKLNEEQQTNIYNAALLHKIGKMGLTDHLIRTPYSGLSEDERNEYHTHPVIGQAVLAPIDELAEAGKIIRSQSERFDGAGFPAGVIGNSIPAGSRLLAIARDFDALQTGIFLGEQVSQEEAIAFIKKNSHKRYDPNCVKAFEHVLSKNIDTNSYVSELKLSIDDLVPGMIITKDIEYREGVCLIRKGQSLTEKIIEKMEEFEKSSENGLIFYVKAEREDNKQSSIEKEVEAS